MNGIYKITCLPTGQQYVGSAAGKKGIQHRWNNHRSLLRGGKHENSHLQSLWKLHGEKNFSFSVVEEVTDGLIAREQYWMDQVPEALRLNYLLAGEAPMLGRSHSEASKEKMRVSRAAWLAADPENSKRLRPKFLPEQRAKMSLAAKARCARDGTAHCSKAAKIGQEKRAALKEGL